ncbi:putative phospholipase/carboxylesterase [Phyllosticta citricarpa]
MVETMEQGDAGDSASLSKTKRKQMIWPDPQIFSPTAPHSHSIILLHGRGSNAERFGVDLLKSRSSEGKNLAECLPGTKFIFPTAKKRRSTVLKRIPINQWFDNFSLNDPSERQHLQYDGIRETSAFIHDLIEKEACLVGLSNVGIGGLSQGCAAALHVLLNFGPKECVGKESASLAGFVGMSGWLPFADMLDPQATDRHEQDGEECVDHEDDDIFGSDGEHSDYDDGNKDEKDRVEGEKEESLEPRQLRAFNTARDIASLPPLSGTLDEAAAFARTPVFLGHGRHDEEVSVKLGSQARAVLEALGCKVRWEDYDEGHWYKVPDEIDDIVDFLQTEAGFRMAENDLV